MRTIITRSRKARLQSSVVAQSKAECSCLLLLLHPLLDLIRPMAPPHPRALSPRVPRCRLDGSRWLPLCLHATFADDGAENGQQRTSDARRKPRAALKSVVLIVSAALVCASSAFPPLLARCHKRPSFTLFSVFSAAELPRSCAAAEPSNRHCLCGSACTSQLFDTDVHNIAFSNVRIVRFGSFDQRKRGSPAEFTRTQACRVSSLATPSRVSGVRV